MSKIKYTIKNLKVSEVLESLKKFHANLLSAFTSIDIVVGKPLGGYMDMSYENGKITITSQFEFVDEFSVFGECQFDIKTLGVDMLIPMYNIVRTLTHYSDSYKVVFLVAFMLAHEIGHAIDIELNSCYYAREILQSNEMLNWEKRKNKIECGILNDSHLPLHEIEQKWFDEILNLEEDYRNLPLESMADGYAYQLINDMTLKDIFGF